MNKIYLTGFMAAGKSSYGKRLAALLDFKFIDLDKVIEQQEGKTIQEIFSQNGINYFRQAEHLALQSTESETKVVISTGGGTPVYFNHSVFLLKSGFVVFLNTPVEIVLDRLLKSENKRPLLENFKAELLENEVKKLFQSRIEFYRKADIIINPLNFPAEELVFFLNRNDKFRE